MQHPRALELRNMYPHADQGLIIRTVAAEKRLEAHTLRAGRKTYRKPAIDAALKEMASAERDLAKLWAQLERSTRPIESDATAGPAPKRLGSGADGLL